MADALREKYETEYVQMADFAIWKRILDYVDGMKQAMIMDVCGTFDVEKFRSWKGELEGIKRVQNFLLDPLKFLAKNQTGEPETKRPG